MSNYSATIDWARGEEEDFLKNRYSRAHQWEFDGGVRVPASASPHIVPKPYSREENVDPEEAFVASLSSCHMLFYLSIAAARGFQVDSYRDQAIGTMAEVAPGRHGIQQVVLNPVVAYSGERRPSRDEQKAMHDQAHEQCFIANSVSTIIKININS